jgi:hypothetical protein
MKPPPFPAQREEHLQALDEFYRTTRTVRLRTRAQMVSAFRRAAPDGRSDRGTRARKRKHGARLAQAGSGRRKCWIAGCLGRWSPTPGDPSVPRVGAAGREASASQPGPAVFAVDVPAVG